MDCSGLGALVASRVDIESQGRSFTITGQTGQRARLVDLIAELESVHGDGEAPSRLPGLNEAMQPWPV